MVHIYLSGITRSTSIRTSIIKHQHQCLPNAVCYEANPSAVSTIWSSYGSLWLSFIATFSSGLMYMVSKNSYLSSHSTVLCSSWYSHIATKEVARVQIFWTCVCRELLPIELSCPSECKGWLLGVQLQSGTSCSSRMCRLCIDCPVLRTVHSTVQLCWFIHRS